MKGPYVAVFALLAVFVAWTARTNAIVPTRSSTHAAHFMAGPLGVEHYEGRGSPVILISGGFCGSWEWDGQIPILLRHHDVYALTLPGFDGVPMTKSDHLFETASRVVWRLIKSRNLNRPVIVGHSLGGSLAILLGAEHGEAIRAVISLDGGFPAASTMKGREKIAVEESAPFLNASNTQMFEIIRKFILPNMVMSTADVQTIAQKARLSDPPAVAEWFKEDALLDVTPELHKIRVPLVYVIPFDQKIDPAQNPEFSTLNGKKRVYERWVDRAPNGRVIAIDHARHFIMFDQPKMLNEVLEKSLVMLQRY